MVKSVGFEVSYTWIQTLALLLNRSEVLGKSVTTSYLSFLTCKMGAIYIHVSQDGYEEKLPVRCFP